jgi:hypothetical protein
MTVRDTAATGRSHTGVEAYPDLNWMTGEKRVRFLISTEKSGDAVFLRIDEVAPLPFPEEGAGGHMR